MNTIAAGMARAGVLGVAPTVGGTIGYVGKFDESTLPDGWGVKYTADGACLRYNKGLVIILR